MDYILTRINQQIELKKVISNDKSELSQLLRVKIEYFLMLILGYLWNKNFDSLQDEETRQSVVAGIIRPSLGTIIDICKKLDIEKEIFSAKKNSSREFKKGKIQLD